jgi:phage terminase large subunit-like protein
MSGRPPIPNVAPTLAELLDVSSSSAYESLSEPSKEILAAVAGGKLHHGGHRVLRWNASCLATVERNDNLMFANEKCG